jgi:outer membrane protein
MKKPVNTTLQLKNAIQQAHNDMETAFEKLDILSAQVDAYKESFRINEFRFINGVSNIVEYTISKNNLDNAEIGLSNVKYEYIFRIKVLDYYRGL